jgi:hypothetical protein
MHCYRWRVCGWNTWRVSDRYEWTVSSEYAVRPEFEETGAPIKGQQASQLQHVTGGVLSWFILAAEIACGRQPANLDHEIDLTLGQTKSASSRDYQRNFNLEKVAAVEWMQILRDTGPAQPGQIDALFKWIDNNDRIYSSTLTLMCRVAARTTGLADLSLQLSSKAFDQLVASRTDAETRVDDLQKLARAIFCVSKSEAAAYFNNAIDIASKIGEEHLSRWTTFLDLADAAHRMGQGRPRTAYRLARIAELSYGHMARDKYMDWDRLVGYVEADLAMKERALATIAPPDTRGTRYRPTDALLKFLQAL